MSQFPLCDSMTPIEIYEMYDEAYYRFLINAGGTHSRRLRFL
jgi:hypothetical protein